MQINAFACKCALQTFQADSDNADLIFRGIVVNKKDSVLIGKVFYTFRVSGVWKGVASHDVTIETNNSGAACGTSFNLNKEYVIYSSNLITTKCRRNSEFSTSADVARLNFKYISSYRENIGNDTLPILSKQEADYFNTIPERLFIHGDNSTSINFTNKKIAFLENRFISKKDFFKRYSDKDAALYFEKFSEKEINASGGYYGMFCLQRKMALSKRQKKKLIEQLHL